MAVSRLSIEEWRLFLGFFKIFIMNYQGLWLINNEVFKRSIISRYNIDSMANLHEEIADVLEKTPNSIRKLEE